MWGYADLVLYNGVLPSRGCPEEVFEGDPYEWDEDTILTQRIALMIIMDAFQEDPRIIQVRPYLAPDIIFAEKLAKSSSLHIPGSGGWFDIRNSMHGKIEFFRTIRFVGATRQDEDTIVARLRETGLEPPYEPHPFKLMQNRAEALHPNQPWRQHLYYCEG